jgi:hypothetical protein
MLFAAKCFSPLSCLLANNLGLFWQNELAFTDPSAVNRYSAPLSREGDIFAVWKKRLRAWGWCFAQLTKSLAVTGFSLGIFVDGMLWSYPVVDVFDRNQGVIDGKVLMKNSLIWPRLDLLPYP